MSGRANRARLLAPSFLVVVSAFACSGKHSDTGPHDGAGGDNGSAGATGNAGTTIGTAGAVTGTAGSNYNPPMPLLCPAVEPLNGAPCSGALSCSYPSTQSVCGLPPMPTQATCQGGVWFVSKYISTCNPPIPFVCPATLPVDGAPCPGFAPPGNQCSYTNAACGNETASCAGSTWQVNRCGVPGGEGGASGAPTIDSAGAAGEAGSPQGGAGGS